MVHVMYEGCICWCLEDKIHQGKDGWGSVYLLHLTQKCLRGADVSLMCLMLYGLNNRIFLVFIHLFYSFSKLREICIMINHVTLVGVTHKKKLNCWHKTLLWVVRPTVVYRVSRGLEEEQLIDYFFAFLIPFSCDWTSILWIIWKHIIISILVLLGAELR